MTCAGAGAGVTYVHHMSPRKVKYLEGIISKDGTDLRSWAGAGKLLELCKENNPDQLDWSGVTEQHLKQLFNAKKNAAKRAKMTQQKGAALNDAFAAAGLPTRNGPSTAAAASLGAASDHSVDEENEVLAADRAVALAAIEAAGLTAGQREQVMKDNTNKARAWYADKESFFTKAFNIFNKHPSSEVLAVTISPMSGAAVSADSRGLLGNHPIVRGELVKAVLAVYEKYRPLLALGQLESVPLPTEARWRRAGQYVLGAGGGFALFCAEHKAELVEAAKQRNNGTAPDGKAISAAASAAWQKLPDTMRQEINSRAAEGAIRGRRQLPAVITSAKPPSPTSQAAPAGVAPPAGLDRETPHWTPAEVLAKVLAESGKNAWHEACLIGANPLLSMFACKCTL